jgi:hypothetical protein
MHIQHKIIAGLTLAVLVFPGVSLAQTMSVAQLQAEIQSLTAQLQSLETQLAAAGGGLDNAVWCYSFNNNLSIGMSGAAVTALQTALQKDGESVTVNSTFDDQTAAAVTEFQEKYASTVLAPNGLSNGTGYVGKSTRAQLNALFGCTGSNPIVPTPPICPAWGCGAPPTTPIVGVFELSIANLSPSSGSVGTSVTVSGSGFGATSTVLINGMVAASLTNLPVSSTGTLTFVVPSSLGPNCAPTQPCPLYLLLVNPGTYNVTVVSNGDTSNALPFTVTTSSITACPAWGCGAPPIGSPILMSTGLSILTPFSNAALTEGMPYGITWSGSNTSAATISLYLASNQATDTADGYANPLLVISTNAVPNSVGQFMWTPPTSLGASNQYYLRMTANGVAAVTGIFTIAPAVNIPVQPVGPEPVIGGPVMMSQ